MKRGRRGDRIPLVFFRTTAGNEPVRAWLKELPQADRHAVGMDLQRVQHRWPVGMPLARPLGNGLWEVRTSLASRDEELVALNGFIKKSRKTPQDELELALIRKKEMEK
jgi:phage-related protein